MKDFIEKILELLSTKINLLQEDRSRVYLAIICAVFGTVFVLIYNPFNIIGYTVNTSIGKLITIKSAGLLGGLTIFFTQVVVRNLIGLKQFTIASFIGWMLFELSAISLVLFTVYREIDQPFWSEMLVTFERSFIISIIPYTLGLLLVSTYDLVRKNNTLNKTPKDDFIKLTDEKGKSILTLKMQNLLYLKAEDNYVLVNYLNKDLVEKILIRNSLKSIVLNINREELVKIHRSYVINKKHIHQLKRTNNKLEIILNHIENKVFQVSSSHTEEFDKIDQSISI